MLIKPFKIKKGDRGKPYIFQIRGHDENGTLQPVDLSSVGAEVKFSMTARGETTPKVSLQSTTIVSAADGLVQYEWLADADVDTSGTFDVECRVKENSAAEWYTLPDDDAPFQAEVIITDRLDPN